jgi:glycyl-tRNA synthetase
MEKTMEKIVALAKARGFVYPGSEIYGGLANTWDYGNLGVELKNNVKKAWWQKFIQESPYNVGVDCAILMNPQTWVASGHLGGFSDPLMDCKECHERFRADKLIEDFCYLCTLQSFLHFCFRFGEFFLFLRTDPFGALFNLL